jgi:hypothetical protein
MATPPREHAPSGSTPRRAALAFLAAFLVCGLFGIEAWPLTGWRLFADARQRHQHGRLAVAVDQAGVERPVPFAELPAGFQGHVQVLRGFNRLADAERAAVCDAWAGELRARGWAVAEIRIDDTVTDVGDRRGLRGAPPRRTPRWVCETGPAGRVVVRQARAGGGRP